MRVNGGGGQHSWRRLSLGLGFISALLPQFSWEPAAPCLGTSVVGPSEGGTLLCFFKKIAFKNTIHTCFFFYSKKTYESMKSIIIIYNLIPGKNCLSTLVCTFSDLCVCDTYIHTLWSITSHLLYQKSMLANINDTHLGLHCIGICIYLNMCIYNLSHY